MGLDERRLVIGMDRDTIRLEHGARYPREARDGRKPMLVWMRSALGR
jgi:hypothetical protein